MRGGKEGERERKKERKREKEKKRERECVCERERGGDRELCNRVQKTHLPSSTEIFTRSYSLFIVITYYTYMYIRLKFSSSKYM